AGGGAGLVDEGEQLALGFVGGDRGGDEAAATGEEAGRLDAAEDGEVGEHARAAGVGAEDLDLVVAVAMIAGDGGAKGGAVGEERALAGRAGRNGDVHRRARERAEQRAVELEGGSRGLQARDRGEVEVLLLER